MRYMLGAMLILAACGQAEDKVPQSLPLQDITVGSKAVHVQVADDDQERSKGLMYVKSMPDNAGMLFVWPEAQERSFWMRNTYMPLDLLFIRDGKVVSVIAWAKPMDESGLPSGEPADMVLEMNGGWAARNDVEIGSEILVK